MSAGSSEASTASASSELGKSRSFFDNKHVKSRGSGRSSSENVVAQRPVRFWNSS